MPRAAAAMLRKGLTVSCALLSAGCVEGGADGYLVEQSIRDDATGLFVELGWVSNISSHCMVVNVFRDQSDARPASDATNAIMWACNVTDWRFRYDDGCYVMSIGYSSGGLEQETWVDETTGQSLCFRMWPPRK